VLRPSLILARCEGSPDPFKARVVVADHDRQNFVSLLIAFFDMIVSWNWLNDYVKPGLSVEETAERLTMSGMNLETIEPKGNDFAVDLEVTSNRPDCLGHLGVAREVGVLAAATVVRPEPDLKTVPGPGIPVEVQCPDLCPSYSARVIRGVKIGPSPAWLRERLEAVGLASVNNVVDATNYVLMECGQPLHAFDLDQLGGGKIVVRRALENETLEAIDHRTYKLAGTMCTICDASKPIALGGVMGGARSEVSATTRNIVIESAAFLPASIRSTARALNLHSPASYRYERGVDLTQLDWASRRCCELILKTAGGQIDETVSIVEAPRSSVSARVTMRFARIAKVIGIEIPEARSVEILKALGLALVEHQPGVSSTWTAPAWRRDLTREIDLIEEVARIHGYEHIPETASLPTAVVARRTDERVRERMQQVMAAAGFQESLTFSFTIDQTAELFVPPGVGEPLRINPAAGEFGSRMRQSLVPSLVLARRDNERRGVMDADLFEIARVYLGVDPAVPQTQPQRLSLVTGRSFREVKGVLETLVTAVNPSLQLESRAIDHPAFQGGRGAELFIGGQPWGWMGELERTHFAPLREQKLRDPATVAEVDVATLVASAATDRVPQPLPEYPAIERDFNFVIDDATTWDQVAEVVRNAAGEKLEALRFIDQYRGQQIPVGKKSYVVGLTYRAADRTLTSDEVEAAQAAVLAAMQKQLAATQR
jgi:phenylalanyl-tRNA synthetase beta chain